MHPIWWVRCNECCLFKCYSGEKETTKEEAVESGADSDNSFQVVTR